MSMIEIKPLQEDLSFGARIRGVTREGLEDAGLREQINEVFEDRGMIVFEEVEQTGQMQVKLSEVFGPLKDHPVKLVERVNADAMPGVITIRTDPTASIVEIDGKPLITWQPWHFDHAYNNELNRAGVLRADTIALEDGKTAFADGIQIYNDLPADIRAKIEHISLIYTLDLRYTKQKFGLPKNFRELRGKDEKILELVKTWSRSIHPAVWTRETGEKVFHMTPYGCDGIEGNETPEGIAMLQEVWDAVEEVMKPYYHAWKPTDMVAWDNWRMLHEACGCDPKYQRVMHRTTIKGDYGLGRWEHPEKMKQPAEASPY